MSAPAQLYRASLLSSSGSRLAEASLTAIADAGVLVEDGTITAVGEYADMHRRVPTAEVTDLKGGYLLPGFVDTHVHLPQLAVIGSMGLTLLDWLEERTFPEELRFADPDYARQGALRLLERLIRNGTTSALVFGAHQKSAMEQFFEVAEQSGLRLAAGLVTGDRNLPEGLRTSPERAAAESLELAERWHGRGRLRYAVTPRFSVSASAELLAACGEVFRSRDDLLFTTHLNEMPAEIEVVLGAFPEAEDYLATYGAHGLVTDRSLFAHNVHPTPDELGRLAAAGSSVCHCPSSNLFLGSGLFPLAAHQAAGVHVALGSDVGAGTSYSLLNEALHAHLHQMNVPDGVRLQPAQLLWLATRAGALALDLPHSGSLEPGMSFDAVVLRPAPDSTLAARLEAAPDPSDALAALITLAREDAVRAVYVQGEQLLADGQLVRMVA